LTFHLVVLVSPNIDRQPTNVLAPREAWQPQKSRGQVSAWLHSEHHTEFLEGKKEKKRKEKAKSN
jgi:hypothetical protein